MFCCRSERSATSLRPKTLWPVSAAGREMTAPDAAMETGWPEILIELVTGGRLNATVLAGGRKDDAHFSTERQLLALEAGECLA